MRITNPRQNKSMRIINARQKKTFSNSLLPLTSKQTAEYSSNQKDADELSQPPWSSNAYDYKVKRTIQRNKKKAIEMIFTKEKRI